MRFRWWLLLGVIPLLFLPSIFFTVDRTEFVYVTQFGKRVAVYDGAKDEEAGLNWKWPWPIQAVQRLDRRLQYFDLPGAELLTRDTRGNTIDKTLTIDAYVCWRIPDASAADQFVRSVGTPEGAQQILGQRITSELGAAIAGMELDDLISVDRVTDQQNREQLKVDVRRKELHRRLLEGGSPSLQETALKSYGIEVVDIRLRRSNHPAAVRDAIFERIRSERAKKVAEYQSEGERLAANIRSETDRRIAEMKAEAEAKSIALRGEADAEADRIRNEASARDPEFYSFLRKMEEYQRILGDGKSTLLLSTRREAFDALLNPPKSTREPVPGPKEEKKKEK
jgi:membrane protease subunit HflC